jgi:hypothetical protein
MVIEMICRVIADELDELAGPHLMHHIRGTVFPMNRPLLPFTSHSSNSYYFGSLARLQMEMARRSPEAESL